MDYVRIACARLGVASDQVLVHRIEGDELVLVVDRGIAGCPKYRLPLASMRPSAPPKLDMGIAVLPTEDDEAEVMPLQRHDDEALPRPKRGRPRKGGGQP